MIDFMGLYCVLTQTYPCGTIHLPGFGNNTKNIAIILFIAVTGLNDLYTVKRLFLKVVWMKSSNKKNSYS